MKIPATFAALSMALALIGCNGDLTRDQAQKMLNADRGAACESKLKISEGEFERAVADGKIKKNDRMKIPRGMLAFVADIPGGQDRWGVDFEMYPRAYWIRREKDLRRCLNGRAEVTAILDAPIGSLKIVEFTEIVSLPQELMYINDYVYTRYKKETGFQRTDQGWRIAR